jgi:hypothetical protein
VSSCGVIPRARNISTSAVAFRAMLSRSLVTFGKDNRCVNSSMMARSCCIRHRRAASPAELVWPDTPVTHHSATGSHNHRIGGRAA